MLVFNFMEIGNKLLAVRKRMGLTQAEVAERAGLSDRAYADIERGTVNMRIETFLQICNALSVTPDAILTENNTSTSAKREELTRLFQQCTPSEQQTALSLLEVYLRSLK